MQKEPSQSNRLIHCTVHEHLLRKPYGLESKWWAFLCFKPSSSNLHKLFCFFFALNLWNKLAGNVLTYLDASFFLLLLKYVSGFEEPLLANPTKDCRLLYLFLAPVLRLRFNLGLGLGLAIFLILLWLW